jgi:hypothetical protein
MPRSRLNALSIPENMGQEAGVVAKRALYSGAVGALGAALLFGEGVNTAPFLNMPFNSAIVVGASVAAGSVVSDLTADYVINRLDENDGLKTIENTGIKVAIAGGGTLLGLKYLSNVEPSLNSFALGATSKVLGDGIYTGYDPALLGMLF